MAGPLDGELASAILDRETSARKRRKVRKGTRSCWECKRRKIRCIYSSAEEAVCAGCTGRGAPCVSQDLPENSSPATQGSRHLVERIAKLEDVVRSFLACPQVHATDPGQGTRRPDPDALSRARAYDNSAPSSIRAPLTPAESIGHSTPKSTLFPLDTHTIPGRNDIEAEAVRHLLAALPTEQDVRILLRESARTSVYTTLINTQQHSELTLEKLAPPYPTADIPGPHLHPILLAKCMLTFAIALQSSGGEEFLGQISETPRVLSRRLVATATTWVTAQEELHGTVESLLCIMLEGVYKVNCGNLRQAWAAYRRAMTVAQLMGLHRSPMPPLQRIDQELVVDPGFMWFRIVYMDRYLSLLLGLPQGTSDEGIGATTVLQHQPSLGKFERQLTIIASRVLQRDEKTFTLSDITTTLSLDSDLLRVSQSVPASFWGPMDFHNLVPGSPENFLEGLRLAAQVYYYGLLIQLHLPYMMHGMGDTRKQEYSKLTCVNASREILTRFIAHRTFRPTASCSRPVDFFALLAAMTLLLAHLDTHNHRPATHSLAHQRLSDRAMLDQALKRMDVITKINKDPLTDQSAKLIRRLLDVEADAVEGNGYTTRKVTVDEDATQEDTEKEGGALRLYIPYLGVIKITRQSTTSQEQPWQRSGESQPPQNIQVASLQITPTLASSNNINATFSQISPPAGQHQPVYHLGGILQGFTTGSDDPSASERPSTQPHAATGREWQFTHTLQSCDFPDLDDIALQPHIGLPNITAGADNWAFQGVDTAFFDSLMRWNSSPDAVGLDQ